MKKIIKIIFCIIISCNFTAYSQSLNQCDSTNITSLYQQSQQKLKEKKFNDALSILKKIQEKYSDNDKIQINLIYAYYKNLDFNKAKETIEKFKKLYPCHENMDYVSYIENLIYIKIDQNLFFPLTYISFYKEDPVYAQKAFFQLKKFITNYPNSKYVINAKKQMICLKNRLAKHSFKILQYYFLNKEYISVINRAEDILKKYPDTMIVPKTLILMEKSYRKLHIFDTSIKIHNVINANKH